MNILHLEYAGGIGGIEKMSLDIATNDKKNKNYFLFARDGGIIYDEMNEKGCFVESLNLSNKAVFKLLFEIRKNIKKNDIDIVVIHHPAPLIWFAMLLLLSKKQKFSTIVYVHNTYEEIIKRKKCYKYIYNYLLYKVNHIIAISHFVKNSIINATRVNDDKVTVIYNGISLLRKKESTTHEDKVNLIFVGRLIEEKGVQVLLESLSLLKNKSEFYLQIVGNGTYEQELHKLTKEYGLEDCVKFLGSRRDIENLLNDSDVFIHPAIWNEGFGITIVEAMSLGLLCIGTNKGAIPEIIKNDKNGYLVEPNNPQELARILERLSVNIDSVEIRSLREQALKDSQKYTITNLIKNLTYTYKKIISK